MMVKNMGTVDRIVRVVVAALIAVLYFTNVISGTLAVILGIVALIFLATGVVGFCPLYALFKFSTLKKA
jgi:glucose uptake protein GlcU